MGRNDKPSVVNTYNIKWDDLEVNEEWLENAAEEIRKEIDERILRELFLQQPLPETDKENTSE